MKSRIINAGLLVGLAALLALAFIYPEHMICPGDPVEGHAELATDCFACHTPFLGSSPKKCIACHTVADIGLKTTKGDPIPRGRKTLAFHQELTEADCVACHSDHRGVKSFRPVSMFSHELLKADTRKQCDSCHTTPTDALHRDITDNCSACHTQRAWQPATFDHDKYFRFDRHHPAQCDTCHTDNRYDRYSCYGCHAHSRSEVREEHLEEGIRDFETCTDCHRSGNEHEAEYRWGLIRRGMDPAAARSLDFRRERERDDD